MFVFELITLSGLDKSVFNIWHDGMKTVSETKKLLNSSIKFPLKNNVSESICRYELIENNQIIKTEIECYSLRFYELSGIEKLLQEVGFSEIKAFEKDKAVQEHDDLIIFECRK